MSSGGHCIICSDGFIATSDISATPCGHTFHWTCLSNWLVIDRSCPKCRAKVVPSAIIRKLYFDAPDVPFDEDPTYLRDTLNSLQVELREKDKLVVQMERDNILSIKERTDLTRQRTEIMMKLNAAERDQTLLKAQLDFISKENRQIPELRRTNLELTNRVDAMQHLQVMIDSSAADARDILKQYGPNSSRQLSVFCGTLQCQLQKEIEKKQKFIAEVRQLSQEMRKEKANHAKEVTALISSHGKAVNELNVLLAKVEEEVVKLNAKLSTQKKELASQKLRLDAIAEDEAMFSESSNAFPDLTNSCVIISDDDDTKENILQILPNTSTPRQRNMLKSIPVPSAERPRTSLMRQGPSPASRMTTGAVAKKRSAAPEAKVKPPFTTYGIMKKRLVAGPPSLAATSAPNSSRARACTDQGYNGLGGHSKPEIFPKGASVAAAAARGLRKNLM